DGRAPEPYDLQLRSFNEVGAVEPVEQCQQNERARKRERQAHQMQPALKLVAGAHDRDDDGNHRRPGDGAKHDARDATRKCPRMDQPYRERGTHARDDQSTDPEIKAAYGFSEPDVWRSLRHEPSVRSTC